ncbi:MAG: hypothetical protein EBR82_60185 [Caulobacteraceae bacterium]|nr:hypothetical protein [Caulobacteraceae bacterium]
MPDVRVATEHDYAVVSGLCLGGIPTLLEVLATGLKAEHITHPLCAGVFTLICSHMENTKRAMDRVTLRTLIVNAEVNGQKYDVTNASRLVDDFFKFDVTPAQTVYHARQCIELSTMVHADIALKVLSNDLESWGGTATGFLEEAQKRLSDVSQSAGVVQAKSAMADVVPDWWTTFEADYKSREVQGKLRTGMPSFDRVLKGFPSGTFTVIGARTGDGKTALSGQIAYESCKVGAKGRFYSLEMTLSEMLAVFLWRDSNVHPSFYDNRQMTEQHWEVLRASKERLKRLPLSVVSSPRLTLSSLIRDARRAKFYDDIDFVLVDYLQLVRAESTRKGANRTEIVGEISHELKALSLDLQIPVIAPVQLNRDTIKEKREPTKADIREAGDIEHDADIVLLLYPHERDITVTEDRLPDETDYFLKVDKFRRGKAGFKTSVVFNKPLAQFREAMSEHGNF